MSKHRNPTRVFPGRLWLISLLPIRMSQSYGKATAVIHRPSLVPSKATFPACNVLILPQKSNSNLFLEHYVCNGVIAFCCKPIFWQGHPSSSLTDSKTIWSKSFFRNLRACLERYHSMTFLSSWHIFCDTLTCKNSVYQVTITIHFYSLAITNLSKLCSKAAKHKGFGKKKVSLLF